MSVFEHRGSWQRKLSRSEDHRSDSKIFKRASSVIENPADDDDDDVNRADETIEDEEVETGSVSRYKAEDIILYYIFVVVFSQKMRRYFT